MTNTTANRELNLIDLDNVAGGAKGDSGGLDAAKSIDLTKFLVGSDGTVVKRYAPSDKPEAIAADLAVRL